MKHRSFQALLAELLRTIGASATPTLSGTGLCRFNGLDVAIYHDERTDPNNVHAYIAFGAVPVARQREVFRTLLLRHVNLPPPHRAVVGLDSASGNIVLVARIPFDAGLSGVRLAGILRRLIRQVLIWRSPAPAIRVPAGHRGTSRRPS
jgi:Tir chaperone protein (CesT) family